MIDILDASALLAVTKSETGGEVIKNLLKKSEQQKITIFMHQINFVEFVYKCQRVFGEDIIKKIIADLESPFLGIVNYMEKDMGFYASHLKANYHLSLGDAIGLAYTKMMDGTFWSADKALQEIAKKEGIRVKIFR